MAEEAKKAIFDNFASLIIENKTIIESKYTL